MSGKRKRGGAVMRKIFKTPLAGCAVLCVLGIMLSSGPGMCGDTVYEMTGKISAIVPEDDIVVIEVPMEGDRTFTVGGCLAADAVLRKGDDQAALTDFSPGQQVTVKWKRIEGGHLILKLQG
jgi:hypothetical protein